MENGSVTDIFEYNYTNKTVFLNGEIFGNTSKNTSLSRAASCTIPLISGLKDEQGYLAIYEGCATSTIPAATMTSYAIAAISVFTGVPILNIKNALLSFFTTTVLPTYLDRAMSSARQQYRSKYTLFNPYNGLKQYKRLYNSYIFIVDYKLYGPSVSGWFF